MPDLKSYIELIENKLSYYNPQFDNLQKSIYKAANYSLEAGGKRLRPVLLMEACRVCGGKAENAIPFACALEMIHTYSLIHDDLPAMDNDDLRRGKPTNHKVFGEAVAILAGDALLTGAFNVMSEAEMEDKTNQLKAIAYMSRSAGTEGMIGGQIVDIENENKPTDIDTLRYMHSLKTGALIKAACVIGGIVAGASDKKLEILSDYAENLGIAFQIKDDILDVSGSVDALGKPIGSDAKSNKSTYVSLLGIEKSQELCAEYTEKALNCLAALEGDTNFLEGFTRKLLNRNS